MNLAEEIEKRRIVVIVRGTYGEELKKLAAALYDGGIRFLEVTFYQADPDCVEKTTEAIKMLCGCVPKDMHIGAGTVLTEAQVLAAHAAGAKFIISPNTNENVIRLTKHLGLVSIPGAMTPSEILQAHDCGADMVKVFPFDDLGLHYIKGIRAPISHVKLMATGGVNEDNFADALKAGFSGAGISGRLTDKKLIAEDNFAELTRRAGVFTKIADSFNTIFTLKI